MIGRKIGEGGNSEVFEWGDDNKIIKLAKPNTSILALEREYRNNLMAWKMGLSVPKPYEIVEFDQRPGIVFERIYGETLKERLFNILIQQINADQLMTVWNDVRYTARLLSEIHHLSHEGIPPQREFLKRQIRSVGYLGEEEKSAIIDILDSFPIKSQICHGDPNPNNILMSNGKAVMIDWNDATSGNPETDLAEYIIMIRFAVLPSDTPQNVVNVFDSLREGIIDVFLDEYTLLTGTTYEEVEPWIIPIAARKLSADAISNKEKQLLVNEIRIGLRYKENKL
ncbi:phosphotransferase [Paucisalibacillus sp. EB02]|uniref:phosphotransferase n=1 Tax=Paucisalibacillus sp. EB02 TaxID=1347087 RepID=UPI0004B5FFA7|nr:aminoglycoside phosphotransferase family protein [Paucisalibacillus sp. EB02]